MQDAITWEIINNVWPIVLGVIAIVVWLNKRFSSADKARSEMEGSLKTHMDKRVGEVEVKISALSERTSDVEKDLLRHQRYAAENFATKQELERSHDAVRTSIDKLSDKLDDFRSEMQSFNDKSTKPKPQRTRRTGTD